MPQTAPMPSLRRFATASADRRGAAVGLFLIAVASVADVLADARQFPLTAVLLGPLVASAVARPRPVACLAGLSVLAAWGLATYEQLPSGEEWPRVVLVAAAGAASYLVARLRTARERELAQANRVAGMSQALQLQLLPELTGTEQVAVEAVYRPSSGEMVLAGDFIDVVPFPSAGPGAVAFCVGDVSGHDATAAGLAAGLRAAWRTLALAGGDPESWLQALDAFVQAEAKSEKFATACVGVLDPDNRRLNVASAGHPRPVLLGAEVTPLHVEPGPPLGLPLGLATRWHGEVSGLHATFSLLLYTDGLVEGRRAPGSAYRYGEESLAAWLEVALRTKRITEADLDRLVRDAEAANGGRLTDDVAIVVLSGRAGTGSRPSEKPAANIAEPA